MIYYDNGGNTVLLVEPVHDLGGEPETFDAINATEVVEWLRFMWQRPWFERAKFRTMPLLTSGEIPLLLERVR